MKRETKKTWDIGINDKMADLSLAILIIILRVN